MKRIPVELSSKFMVGPAFERCPGRSLSPQASTRTVPFLPHLSNELVTNSTLCGEPRTQRPATADVTQCHPLPAFGRRNCIRLQARRVMRGTSKQRAEFLSLRTYFAFLPRKWMQQVPPKRRRAAASLLLAVSHRSRSASS
jgi:hypothetical protein